MSNDLLVIVSGAATAALAVAFGLPQFFRVRRTGSVAGVSLPSVTNTVVSTTAWLVYGVHLHDFWVVLTAAVGLPSLVATFVAVVRRSDDRTGMWLPLVWAAILAATAALLATVQLLIVSTARCRATRIRRDDEQPADAGFTAVEWVVMVVIITAAAAGIATLIYNWATNKAQSVANQQ